VRTVYLGTSEFAVAVLKRLEASPHAPELVISRPDSRRGRGRRTGPPPVAQAARTLGIELYQPERVGDEDARERIAACEPDAVVICAYGALIREPLLSAYPMFNVHPSLLPRWRGAAPVERAIEAGDERTGVCIMRPTRELDAGPVCLAEGEPIRPDDDYDSLSERLAHIAGELLVRALDERPDFVPQPEEGVTIASKVEPVERELRADRTAAELERRVRALSHLRAYVSVSGVERLGVRRARLSRSPEPAPAAAPGALAVHEGRLLFGAADGPLELLEVRPSGGRAMDAAAYLRGHGAGIARVAA
jgi:methionyl-tRNA formyltransferase